MLKKKAMQGLVDPIRLPGEAMSYSEQSKLDSSLGPISSQAYMAHRQECRAFGGRSQWRVRGAPNPPGEAGASGDERDLILTLFLLWFQQQPRRKQGLYGWCILQSMTAVNTGLLLELEDS